MGIDYNKSSQHLGYIGKSCQEVSLNLQLPSNKQTDVRFTGKLEKSRRAA